MKRLHCSRLPISKSLLQGLTLSEYYYCDVIPTEVALSVISESHLHKKLRNLYCDDFTNTTKLVFVQGNSSIIATTERLILQEASRSQIVSLSKRDTKSRFVRRRTISESDVNYKSIDTKLFMTQGILRFNFKVRDYDIVIEVQGLLDYLKQQLGTDTSVTYKHIQKYLSKALDANDIKIDCTCPDFRYRFAYTATVGKYKANSPENRPSNITNPNLKGSSCKHLLYLLNNKRWINKYISMINVILRLNPMLLDRK